VKIRAISALITLTTLASFLAKVQCFVGFHAGT
jgi:hypothetical protein